MITPLDAVYQMSSKIPEREAHYHLESFGEPAPAPKIMDYANFHIIDRTIGMAQIGFDHYYNVVTYRI